MPPGPTCIQTDPVREPAEPGQPEVNATIETITVLFTDIVSSTELASSVSPDEADAIRRSHFSILRQAVAEAGGTEVKNVGDGVMVAFSSASSALTCAVSMQQRVGQHNRSIDRYVGLRVGLSSGEVTMEESDYFGDPVIEAARLCAACEGGQIIAADSGCGHCRTPESACLYVAGRAEPQGPARPRGSRGSAMGAPPRKRSGSVDSTPYPDGDAARARSCWP